MVADGELQREFQGEITVNGGPCCLPSGPLKLFINGMKREHGIQLTINSLASCKKRFRSLEISTVGMICSKQRLLQLTSKTWRIGPNRKVSFALLEIV